ncbi:MAG: DUF1549 domain-containing protein, partial [Verrucomicrobiae bacterium]|nr:DUF1549 domain-containing protein [Verrucomicrobiae bacterium]
MRRVQSHILYCALIFQSAAVAKDLPWSFARLPSMPAASPVAAAARIDQLIATRLRDSGLSSAAEADRRTLLRRLSFDLVGLPPSPGAV